MRLPSSKFALHSPLLSKCACRCHTRLNCNFSKMKTQAMVQELPLTDPHEAAKPTKVVETAKARSEISLEGAAPAKELAEKASTPSKHVQQADEPKASRPAGGQVCPEDFQTVEISSDETMQIKYLAQTVHCYGHSALHFASISVQLTIEIDHRILFMGLQRPGCGEGRCCKMQS